jgi:hypothetical protein
LFCEVSAAVAFLLFFFVVAVLSVWSDAVEDPDCCAARDARMPPNIRSAEAMTAKTSPLRSFI